MTEAQKTAPAEQKAAGNAQAEADKAAAEKATADKKVVDAKAAADKAAAEAQAAADKAAAEQALADQKALAEEQSKMPVIVHGTAGGPFSIDGTGFGGSGTLTIGGRTIQTVRWEDRTIRGTVPPGTRGEVVLTTASGVVRKGTFPYSPPQATRVTTTVVEAVPGSEAAVLEQQQQKQRQQQPQPQK